MKFHKTLPVRTHVQSPLGGITLAATANGLAGLWFDGQKHLPDMTDWPVDDAHPVLQQAAQLVQRYFAGETVSFDMPLDLSHGTAFQQSVWRALLGIPRGQTTSYAALGTDIGKPAAVRAVGAAVGRNPLSVVVPCHRVLGSDGSLTGYAGGLERKTALLGLEGAL